MACHCLICSALVSRSCCSWLSSKDSLFRLQAQASVCTPRRRHCFCCVAPRRHLLRKMHRFRQCPSDEHRCSVLALPASHPHVVAKGSTKEVFGKCIREGWLPFRLFSRLMSGNHKTPVMAAFWNSRAVFVDKGEMRRSVDVA